MYNEGCWITSITMALSSLGVTETKDAHYDPRTDSVRKMQLYPITVALANWSFPDKSTYTSYINQSPPKNPAYVIKERADIGAYFSNISYTSYTSISSCLSSTFSDSTKALPIIHCTVSSDKGHFMLTRSGEWNGSTLTNIRVNDPWNASGDRENKLLSECYNFGCYHNLSQIDGIGLYYKQ